MKYIIIILTSIFALTSCEKEIYIDYRSVDKLYVIEGSVTNEEIKVLITQTRDMNDSVKMKGLEGASVLLRSDNGMKEELFYNPDGYYRPLKNITGSVGDNYTLTVNIEETDYISSSKMPSKIEIDSIIYSWVDFGHGTMLFTSAYFIDIPFEENYYMFYMKKNGKVFNWDIFYDKAMDGEPLVMDIACMMKSTMEDNKEDDFDRIIFDGDILEIEIRSIDRKTYNYLFSLAMSNNSLTNPLYDFSEKCLGYFSAYSVTKHKEIFSYENVLSE